MINSNNESKNYTEQVQLNKFLLLEDAEDSGLERVIIDRNSFFHGEEVLKYIKGTKEIKICGVALGFFITNKALVASVKNVLVKDFGVDASRIETDGKGEGAPVAKNDSAVNKALNRRVEFIKL